MRDNRRRLRAGDKISTTGPAGRAGGGVEVRVTCRDSDGSAPRLRGSRQERPADAPTLAGLARALGTPVPTLLVRAEHLGWRLLATDRCPAGLLRALAEESSRENAGGQLETGTRQLERTMCDVGWEAPGRTWRPISDVGVGLLGFCDRSILVADDAQARALAFALRVASSSKNLFICGERGTGKENVARACHEASGRRGAFVPINCAAVPTELAEAELFGATTGAASTVKARSGLFRAAEGGTIFLDELSALSLGLQAKLLRVIQERTVRPVGAECESVVDVFVVAASNDIDIALAEGRFRADLADRISRPAVRLPALRGRLDAILAFATYFLGLRSAHLGRRLAYGADAIELLLGHEWPGNVRELEGAVGAAVIAVDRGNVVRGHHLTLSASHSGGPSRHGSHSHLYEHARMLHLDGQSYANIGAAVGLSKRQAYRLLNGQ